MSLPLNKPLNSLCILRLSAIGDATHIVPIVRTLQQVWPKCRLTWILGKTEAGLIDDLENVEFIIFDKAKGIKSYKELKQFLKNREFDAVLHMQASLRASIASLLIKSPIKLGFDKKRAVNLQHLFTNYKIDHQPQQHVLDCFFSFLLKLGIKEKIIQWNIPIPSDARVWANRFFHNRKTLIVNACSSLRAQNWRNWNSKHYAAIIDYAFEKLNMGIILTGGPSPVELEMAQDISRNCHVPLTNLVGKTSLKQLLAVIAKADIMIAPDTGPAHIATAAGVPVIGLYASSNPNRTGPYLSLNHCINKYPQALQKYQGKNIENVRWGQRIRSPDVMELITTEEVIEKLQHIMQITS